MTTELWERGSDLFDADVDEEAEVLELEDEDTGDELWNRGSSLFDAPAATAPLSQPTVTPDEPTVIPFVPDAEVPATFEEALAKEEPLDVPEAKVPEATPLDATAPQEAMQFQPEDVEKLKEDWEWMKGVPSGLAGFAMIPGAVLEKVGKVIDEPEYVRLGQESRKFWGEKTQEWGVERYDVNPAENLSAIVSPGFWAYQVGKQAPLLVAGVTSGGTAVGVLGGLQMGTQTYNSMLEEGYSEGAASRAAGIDAVLGTALERFGANKWLKASGGAIKRVVQGAAGEGVTEYLQEFTSSVNTKINQMIDEGKSLNETANVVLHELNQYHMQSLGAGIVGGGIGGGMAMLSTEGQRKLDEGLVSQMSPSEVQAVLNETVGLEPRDTSEIGWIHKLQKADEAKQNAIRIGREKLSQFEGGDLSQEAYMESAYDTKMEPIVIKGPENLEQGHREQSKAIQESYEETRNQQQEEQGILEQEQIDKAATRAGEEAVQAIQEKVVDTTKSAEESAKVFDEAGETTTEVTAERVESMSTELDALDNITQGQAKVLKEAIESRDVDTIKSARESAQAMEEGDKHLVESILDELEMSPRDKTIPQAVQAAKVDTEIAILQSLPKEMVTGDNRSRLGELLKDQGGRQDTYVSPEPDASQTPVAGGKVYTHDRTGRNIRETADGTWVAEGIKKPFKTVAQARRGVDESLSPAETKSLAKDGIMYADGKYVPVTTGSLERGSEITELKADKPVRVKTKKKTKGKRRKVIPIKDTSLPIEPDDNISQEKQGKAKTISDKLTGAILEGDQAGITEVLNRFPESNRAAVLKDAEKTAKDVAKETGDYSDSDIAYTVEEARGATKGRKEKAGEVVLNREASGLYTGTDPATGNEYTVMKGKDGKYKVLKGKEIVQEGISTEIKDTYAVIKADAIKSSGYDVVQLQPTHPEYDTKRNRWRVVDSKGNLVDSVPGTETKKAATQAKDSLVSKATGKQVVAEGKTSKSDTEAIKHLKELGDKKTKSEPKAKGASEVRKVELTAAQKKEIEDRYNERLEDYEWSEDPEDALGPLMMDETDLKTALDEVLDFASDEHGAIIGMILNTIPREKLEAVQVRPSIFSSTPEARGTWYDTKDNTVYYAPGVSPRTIAHEAIHGVTARELNQLSPTDPLRIRMNKAHNAFFEHVTKKNENGDSLLSEQEMKDTQGSKAERKAALKKYPNDVRRLMYAVGSMEEFFTMALTDPVVRNIAKDITVEKATETKPKVTVWDKIKQTVFDLIGAPKGKYSLLEEMLELTTGIGQIAVDETKVGDFVYGDFETQNKKVREEGLKKDDLKLVEKGSRKAVKSIKYLTRSLDMALKDISPFLYEKFQDYRSRINSDTKSRLERVSVWANEMSLKTLPRKDYEEYHHALLNYHEKGARKVLERLHKEHPKLGSFEDVKSLLDEMSQDMIKHGLLSKTRKHYFPNKVKDLDGLMEYFENKGTGTLYSEIVAQLGPKASQEEIREAVVKAFAQGSYPSMIRKPGSTLKKSIYEVEADMAQYFEHPVEALRKHIVESTKAIEQARLLGKSNWASLEDTISRLKDKPVGSLTAKEEATLAKAEKDMTQLENDLTDTVGDWIAKEAKTKGISATQQRAVRDLLQSHFNYRSMLPWLASVKTAATIGAIGSFTSTIAQIPDVTAPLLKYQGSFLTALMKRIKGEHLYNKDDIIAANVLEQIESGKMSKWLDKTLKWTGFSWADSFFKETAMQAGMDAAKKMSRDAFVDKYKNTYNVPGEVDQLYNDIQSGKKSYNTARFAFNTLSEVQPVDTASMPQAYIDHPNARLAYALQSFAVKQLNNTVDFVKEGNAKGFAGIPPGKPAGAAKMAAYMMLLLAANVPVKCVQRIMVGKDCDFSEHAIDTILSLVFMSRYSTRKLGDGSFSEFLFDSVAPPMGLIEKPIRDLVNYVREDRESTIKTLTEVPIAGKIVHGWFSQEARKARSRKRRERVFGMYEDMARHGATNRDRKELRKLVQEYNKEAIEVGQKPITRETLDNSVKRKAEREAKKAKGKKTAMFSAPKSLPQTFASIGEAVGEAVGPSEAYAGELPEKYKQKEAKPMRRYKALVVGKAAKRLGVPYDEALENLNQFAEYVGMIENSGKTVGDNPKSSASGLYQFTDASIKTALNRLKRIVGNQPWMDRVLKAQDMNILTRDQQTLMFLANLLEMEGSDALMKKVMQGDREAMKKAYAKFHHTNPDVATLDLIEETFTA